MLISSAPPHVSIGLPVYNGENYVAEALDSIVRQTYSDFELIISDNASSDATADICKDFSARDPRIRYHRSPVNRGAAWNFNNVVHLSRGKYFKWAAHDDLHHPRFLERCVSTLDARPEVVLSFTRTTFIDDHGSEIKEYPYPFDVANEPRCKRFLHFACGGHIVHEIFGVIRADILRKTPLIGGYLGSDLVLLGKLSLYGPFYQVPECLFHHREHDKRSMINPQGAANYTEWYDSSKSGVLAMPYWRRLKENLFSVIHHPMDASEKLACLIELCRSARWNQRALLQEIVYTSRKALTAWN